MNQNEREAVLINSDGKKLSCKKIFEELVRERFDRRAELIDETNFHNLMYYFQRQNTK